MQTQTMTVNTWANSVGLSLGRQITGELGKAATSLAHSQNVPLLKEVGKDGNRRNLYPVSYIEMAWNNYAASNPNCPSLSQ